MAESTVTISLKDYNELTKAHNQISDIKRVIEKDDYQYGGLSSDTEKFIMNLLNVEKGSAANE